MARQGAQWKGPARNAKCKDTSRWRLGASVPLSLLLNSQLSTFSASPHPLFIKLNVP